MGEEQHHLPVGQLGDAYTSLILMIMIDYLKLASLSFADTLEYIVPPLGYLKILFPNSI